MTQMGRTVMDSTQRRIRRFLKTNGRKGFTQMETNAEGHVERMDLVFGA